MTRRKYCQIKERSLRVVPMFAACSDRELTAFARLVDECSVPAGRILTREATAPAETFVVVEGRASVEVGGQLVAEVGPGEFVGELGMLNHKLRNATVTAITPMRLLVVGPDAFVEFVEQPAVANQLGAQLAGRLRAMQG